MEMVDITAPEEITIQIREDGKVIWIHTSHPNFPPTVLRACRIKTLIIDDARTGQ